MFDKFKIKSKLIIFFILIGTIPMAIIGLISYNKTSQSLYHEHLNNLNSVNKIKSVQIESYFKTITSQIKQLASSRNSIEAVEKLIHYKEVMGISAEEAFDVSSPEYKEIWAELTPYFKDYIERFDYYDFFICTLSGQIMYTVARESDLGENLQFGRLKDTHIASLWRKVIKNHEVVIEDFAPYEPSNNEPASFIGFPFYKDGIITQVIMLQISHQKINSFMQEKTGMGETGESYLVGSDYLMRSDSRLVSESTLLKQKIKTFAVDEALSGNSGNNTYNDYHGFPVIGAYAPLDIPDLDWVIISEIDEEETLLAANEIMMDSIYITLIVLLLVSIIGYLVAMKLARPIISISNASKQVSQGNLNVHIDIDNKDEIGDLARYFNEMVSNIRHSVTEINNKTIEAEKALKEADELKDAAEAEKEYLSRNADLLLENMDRFSQGDLTMRLVPE